MARRLLNLTAVSVSTAPDGRCGFSGYSAGDRDGQEVTHGNEHDDGEGVVHGVSAHGPPCQTDHLPSREPSAAVGWGHVGGGPPHLPETSAHGAPLNCAARNKSCRAAQGHPVLFIMFREQKETMKCS